jgi:hypothetical protein
MTPNERRVLGYRLAICAVVYDMLLKRLGVRDIKQQSFVLAQL